MVKGDAGVAGAKGAVVGPLEGETKNEPGFGGKGGGDEVLRGGVGGIDDDLHAGDLFAVGEAFGFPLLESGGDGEGGELAVGKQVGWHETGGGAGPDFGFVAREFSILVGLAVAAEIDDVPRAAFGGGARAAEGAGGLEGDDGAVEGLGEFDSDAGEDAGALEGIHRQVEIGGGERCALLEGGQKHYSELP